MANKAKLEKLGYHYPDVCYVYDGHHNLVFDLNEMDKFVPILGGLKDLKAFAQSTQGHIILSSETFDNIVTEAPLMKLKDALGDMFDIHIIGYLRPQDELLQSLWKTDVRFNGVTEDFSVWLPKAMKRWKFLKYDQWISVFLQVFGRENVHFQIYDPKSENLFHSFLKQCSLTELERFDTPKRENVSLPGLSFEVVRRLYLNPYLARRNANDKSVPFKESIYGMVGEKVKAFALKENINLKRSLYTREMLQRVRKTYREHNQAAARLYFKRPGLFQSSKKLQPSEKNPVDMLTTEQALRLGGLLIEIEQSRSRQNTKKAK